MKLSNVLATINAGSSEKTASAKSDPPAAQVAGEKTASDKLVAAMREVTAPAAEKVASTQGSPVGDLTKMASEIAASEQDAMTKEAHAYGAAVADGFIARIAQYEGAGAKVAGVEPTKVASDDSFEKFASENRELVKDAAELGYATTKAQLEKIAAAAEQKGFDDACAAVYKTAQDCFYSGVSIGNKLVQASRR